MGEFQDVTPDMFRKLKFSGTVTVDDDDGFFSDDFNTGSFELAEECSVNPFVWFDSFTYTACQDEVTAILTVLCRIDPIGPDEVDTSDDFRHVGVTFDLTLTEGTDCNSTDVEAKVEDRSMVVPPCSEPSGGCSAEPDKMGFSSVVAGDGKAEDLFVLQNPDFGSDRVTLNVTFFNGPEDSP